MRVFYDEYEKVDLWGKDLYEHLSSIYSDQAQYVVMFISEHYSKKVWTTHERKNAQARAFQEKNEYILPVRFDSTEIPGVLDTVGYIDLSDCTPEDLADMITQKLRNSDYWLKQAEEASEFSSKVLREAHRGAFKWTEHVTAIFDNRVADINDEYFLQLLSELKSYELLGMATYERKPKVMLINHSDARNIHMLVWDCYERLYPSSRTTFQRKHSERPLTTIWYSPFKG